MVGEEIEMDEQKVKTAISCLRQFEPPEGYYLAFSGGKDSCVLKQLAIEAGVKFDAHFHVCTIEPHELTRFLRKHHPEVVWNRPRRPFLRALITAGLPFRQTRWCCREYKEHGGDGRVVLLGIRRAESAKRAKRRMVESCTVTGKTRVSPIIDWTSNDVWSFTRDRRLPYCSLYDDGWKRIGCMFCPERYWKRRVNEALRYPRWRRAFISAIEKLRIHRLERGTLSEIFHTAPDGEAVFWWWISCGRMMSGPTFPL